MKYFLNKICWILSFALSFAIFWSFDLEFWWTFFLGIFFWFIIKWFFLPEDEVYNSLEKFYENILKNIEKEKNISQNIQKSEEKISEKIISKEEKENSDFKIPEKSFASKKEDNLKIEEKFEKDFEKYVKSVEETKWDLSEKVEEISKISENTKNLQNEVWNKLENFFKENLLAKIWAIIIFIWVFFLLVFLWNILSDFSKIILGFIIGFCAYFAWIFLDKKWYIWESRILLWSWIWINFLVILAWRYFFDYGFTENESFSIILTFWALILNTILWIFTALKYKNKTLLIFSFIFAFLNPLLLGTNSDEPYTLLVYSLLVTFASIFIWEKVEDKNLILLSFLAWNTLFLLAQTSDEIWFLTKITFTIISSFMFINSKIVKNFEKESWSIFINSVVFLPIILQSFGKNIQISDLSYFVCFAYSIIIFWYFIHKIKKEENFSILWAWTLLIISLFIGLNLWENSLNFYTFVISIILAFANIILPFFIKNLKNNLNFYGFSLIISSIFLIFTTFLFTLDTQTSANIFMIFAWIYLISWAFLTKIFSISDYKQREDKKLFLLFFSIFLSFLTISTNFILWYENISWQIITTIIFLIEAILLIILSNLTSEKKFKIMSNILSGIWIFKLFFIVSIFNYFSFWEFFSIIVFYIFILKTYLLRKNLENIDYIIHFSWILLSSTMICQVFPAKEIILLTLITILLWFFYKFIENDFFKKIFLWIFVIIWVAQFGYFIEEKNILFGILWIILYFSVTYFYHIKKDENFVNLNTIFYWFLFFQLSAIILEITQTIHSLTIFWWIIWSFLIILWIKKQKVFFRTIWIYLITIIFWKIILLDIWLIWDAFIGMIIFIILWIVLIWTSLFYTKYIWNDISKEFSLENIFWKEKNIYKKEDFDFKNKEENIIENILKTDISWIETVILEINWKEFLKTKYKKIIQILKFITLEKWKNIFEEWELLEFYEKISKKYPQKLTNEERKKAEEFLKNFAEKWWKIKFK